MIYLDYASMGVVPEQSIDLIQDAVRDAVLPASRSGTDRTFKIVDWCERARKKVAGFLKVSPSNVALINNTTHGLGGIASGIRFNAGDNVVIPDMEFLSSTLVWRRIQEKIGLEIRLVKSKRGHLDVSDFEPLIDKRTKAVVASSVQEVSGDRLEVEKLDSLANAHDVLLIIDGIQEAGVLSRDLSNSKMDAYVVGGHKFLGSPFGMGFMYVSNRLLSMCEPAFDGYFNLETPAGGWEMYLQDRSRSPMDIHKVKNEARKFEPGGMPNSVGAAGIIGSLSNIETCGIERIEEHVLLLNGHLRSNMATLKLEDRVLGGYDRKNWSGIVTFSLPGGLGQERSLLDFLSMRSIYVSLRSVSGIGGIRVSFHALTTVACIDRFSEAVEEFLEAA